MKRVRKLIGKLIKYDISCGTKYNYRKYIYIAVFIILNLLVFGNAINFAKIENIDVSIGDLYVYFFRGSGIVNIKTGDNVLFEFIIIETYCEYPICKAINIEKI